jgi:protoporphyrinogen IX oxidase
MEMELAFKFMLFLHLTALAVASTATVVMPLVGRQMATGAPAAKPAMAQIAGRIQIYVRVAFATLLVSGVAMLFMRFGGDVLALGIWFEIKMALVVVAIVAVMLNSFAPGWLKPQIVAMITRLALLGIVACAVLTFG